MTLSKTAAIKKAKTLVTIHKTNGSYIVNGPHQSSDIYGIYIDEHCHSLSNARKARAKWAACVALGMMGKLNDSIAVTVETAGCYSLESHTVETLVNLGLK